MNAIEGSWESTMAHRLRQIFQYPSPPKVVTEKQFDFCDSELHELAKKPWEAIEPGDWWYYILDLAYVELQPELFRYLFPAFLAIWYQGHLLLDDRPASE